ncbi:MAG: Asp-tRNA(Asn)/Glu-tRNA(Gln) amidotransferase GatCAB subunit B, partial [Kiritimatiellales bacterium]|nr:Asp-tRNA(Asn)/Glu-tRNA(Gln) amidotransferase GatCAB subunit B [Kiritimatiellales bacterium]
MPVELEAIIGLEVHAQMSTKSKMFCSCDNDAFGKPPNTTVCPICMGHPGTLPVPNAEAIKKAMRASLAIGCEIQKDNHFDRKHYFYPDLPPGFQISQYDYPIAKGGEVEYNMIDASGQSTRTKT